MRCPNGSVGSLRCWLRCSRNCGGRTGRICPSLMTQEAVTLTEVKDGLCFKTLCSRGITAVINLTANTVSYCPCSGVTASPVCNRHQVACTPFSAEHRECSRFSHPGTCLSSRWCQGSHTLSFTGLPPLTLLKGLALKSQRGSLRRRGRSAILYSSPRPLPSQHARPKRRSTRSIGFVSHSLLSKRQTVSQRVTNREPKWSPCLMLASKCFQVKHAEM
jgi:hypothetical protein